MSGVIRRRFYSASYVTHNLTPASAVGKRIIEYRAIHLDVSIDVGTGRAWQEACAASQHLEVDANDLVLGVAGFGMSGSDGGNLVGSLIQTSVLGVACTTTSSELHISAGGHPSQVRGLPFLGRARRPTEVIVGDRTGATAGTIHRRRPP